MLDSLNFKDENGNFNPSMILSNLDKIEPMLPMLDGLMQTYKPEGSDGVFLMGSIEQTVKDGPRPILRLMGFKVVVDLDESQTPILKADGHPQKHIEITDNCKNEKGETLKFDLLSLMQAAGKDTPENNAKDLGAVLD
jgi:hypothetical protein